MAHSNPAVQITRAIFSHRYDKNLAEAQSWGIKKGSIIGIFQGYLWFIVFLCLSLAFWYGSKLIIDTKELSPGSLIQVRDDSIGCSVTGCEL